MHKEMHLGEFLGVFKRRRRPRGRPVHPKLIIDMHSCDAQKGRKGHSRGIEMIQEINKGGESVIPWWRQSSASAHLIRIHNLQ